jgi:hypothetical protein
MAHGFPPQPVYPKSLDSDYTLFMVYNTSEAVLVSDNDAWSDEIIIKPVPATKDEIWSDNGFCTIEGELIYYDAVEKTTTIDPDDARVFKLKRCARNLGGKRTKFNAAGTWVRGFVIAEHHNQLVDVLLNMEDFVGVNFDNRVETLDYRIRHLNETPIIFDDFSCPDVSFFFEIIKNDPASGVVAQYEIQIGGNFNTFRLDFGDGAFTSSERSGTHTYALNSQIDPVVTITNNQCQIIQTPITRENPSTPQPVQEPPIFNVTIPEVIDIPPIIVPSITPPPIKIDIPPLLFPCIDITPFPGISINIGPINVQVPSVVSFTPINIPSVVSFTPINLPSIISFTPINLPSIIDFGPAPSFSPIGFGPAPSIAPIEFGPAPSIAPINVDVTVTVDAGGIPSCIPICDSPSHIAVDWGAPPTLNVAFVQSISAQSAKRRQKTKEEIELERELGEEFSEFFADQGDDSAFQVEYTNVGIPHEITIKPPEFADIKLVHDLPHKIDLELVNIPEIRIANIDAIPKSIELVSDLPSIIRVEHDIPSVITLEHNLPNEIRLVGMEKIPDSIYLDASGIPDTIQVVGVPQTIELKAPESIKLVLDENVEVPLVYKGAPIELKIDMPKEWSGEGADGEDYPCVMIVPCPRK